jgi:hypothetical protein
MELVGWVVRRQFENPGKECPLLEARTRGLAGQEDCPRRSELWIVIICDSFLENYN